MTSWWPYLHKGDDRRAHEHERRVQCGPQQKGEGEPASLRELVDIWHSSRTSGSFTPGLPAALLQPGLLSPERHPGHETPPRSHASPMWLANTPGSEAGPLAPPGTGVFCGGAHAPFCAGDYGQRILSLTTLYFRPATFSTTMSMKQATRPVRIPIMAQMTQRFISTVRKAYGEGNHQKQVQWGWSPLTGHSGDGATSPWGSAGHHQQQHAACGTPHPGEAASGQHLRGGGPSQPAHNW